MKNGITAKNMFSDVFFFNSLCLSFTWMSILFISLQHVFSKLIKPLNPCLRLVQHGYVAVIGPSRSCCFMCRVSGTLVVMATNANTNTISWAAVEISHPVEKEAEKILWMETSVMDELYSIKSIASYASYYSHVWRIAFQHTYSTRVNHDSAPTYTRQVT